MKEEVLSLYDASGKGAGAASAFNLNDLRHAAKYLGLDDLVSKLDHLMRRDHELPSAPPPHASVASRLPPQPPPLIDGSSESRDGRFDDEDDDLVDDDDNSDTYSLPTQVPLHQQSIPKKRTPCANPK